MATSVNKTKTKGCGSCGCAAKKTRNVCKAQNGKGDKPRPFSKSDYNKNYESINWSKK